MFPVTIATKSGRYPVMVYPVYYTEIDEVIYEAVHTDKNLSAKGRTMHNALEELALLLIENE
jgi:hypothetical protein